MNKIINMEIWKGNLARGFWGFDGFKAMILGVLER